MKKLAFLWGFIFLAACSQENIPPEGLEDREGLEYAVGSQKPYSGPVKIYHENGRLNERYNLENGIRIGLFESFYINGQLKWKYTFENGNLDGLAEYYHENGQLRRRYSVENGILDGLEQYYYDDGQLMASTYRENGQPLSHKRFYKNGRPEISITANGYEEGYHDNGRLEYKVKVLSLKLNEEMQRKNINALSAFYYVGKYESFHKNGRMAYKTNYVNGKKNGPTVEYYDNGNIKARGTFVDGEFDGLWEVFRKNGELSYTIFRHKGKDTYKGKKINYKELPIKKLVERQGVFYEVNSQSPFFGIATSYSQNQNYREGKKWGSFEVYYGNKDYSQLKSKSEYEDGKETGLWLSYYQDGQLKGKLNFEAGKLDGPWESYYENGQLKEKGRYKEDRLNGLYEGYYPNGQLSSKSGMVKGERDGFHEAYKNNGELIFKRCYKEGIQKVMSDCLQ